MQNGMAPLPSGPSVFQGPQVPYANGFSLESELGTNPTLWSISLSVSFRLTKGTSLHLPFYFSS